MTAGSLAVLGLVLFASGTCAAQDAPTKLNVLFIGNSLTRVNNLPGIIAGMAAASGRTLTFSTQLVSAASLAKHWKDGKALAKIQEGHWDYVVLQDYSKEAYKDPESMEQYVRLFDAEIHKAGGRTLLYMNWALENAPDEYPQIVETFTALARELHASLAPVGSAWHTVTSAPGKPAFALYVSDHKHPKPAGSYLAACVFYRVLFGVPSAGLPSRIEWETKVLVHLSKEDASALQQIADQTPLVAD
jgi:hypothetical protein